VTEQQIQKKIITYLESKGAYVVKVIQASKSGVADLIVCYRGKFISIEVKTPTTKTNVAPLQKYNLRKVFEAEGISTVAWELSQVEELLGSIDDSTITKPN
jgi:Holliday junction resolvase-like predicted endonuclease